MENQYQKFKDILNQNNLEHEHWQEAGLSLIG